VNISTTTSGSLTYSVSYFQPRRTSAPASIISSVSSIDFVSPTAYPSTMPTTKPKGRTKRETEELDLLPREEALQRSDELLRRMLNSPPDPYTPKPKAKKRARK
jgi:hypothetical protein